MISNNEYVKVMIVFYEDCFESFNFMLSYYATFKHSY